VVVVVVVVVVSGWLGATGCAASGAVPTHVIKAITAIFLAVGFILVLRGDTGALRKLALHRGLQLRGVEADVACSDWRTAKIKSAFG
jgi:DMSO/TMAO reductase YedYZ heme-binding membrane subunit